MTLAAELNDLDAIGTAELIRGGQVTALEVIEATIDRIERENVELNAVNFKSYDQARAQVARGLPQGPLTGVPFLLKDLLAEASGMPLSAGSRFVSNHHPVSSHDSEIVKRHKRAGLVILGKTNTPEFGILCTTEPAAFGPTRNPWDPRRTAGGSSGGAAAAVAAGLVPVAHASDGGGSIRIPASCCGVFGLKPTRARNSLAPHGDIKGGLVVEHAISRSVRDSAALLDATRGSMPGDPYGVELPLRPFLEEVGSVVGRLRIGFSTKSLLGVEASPDCVQAVHSAAQLCSALGHEVEEAQPEVDGRRMGRAFTILWTAGAAWSASSWELRLGETAKPGDLEPLTAALVERSAAITAADYLMAMQEVQEQSRNAARFHETHDLWLTPTLAEPPVPLGTFASPAEDPMSSARRMSAFAPFTHVANITGQPAMSVPLHWTASGLPVGVQFTARFGDEAMLFRLAAQLEQARPWSGRRPQTEMRARELRT
jgi:amidase